MSGGIYLNFRASPTPLNAVSQSIKQTKSEYHHRPAVAVGAVDAVAAAAAAAAAAIMLSISSLTSGCHVPLLLSARFFILEASIWLRSSDTRLTSWSSCSSFAFRS